MILVSSTSGGNVDGMGFSDEDIIALNAESGIWSRYFDGSDVGLGYDGAKDIDAFHLLNDGSILLSVTGDTNLPDVGSIDDADIVRFVPTSLGANTAGHYELYFDGSDVGLTTNSEDIDGLTLLSNGDLLISTVGGHNVGFGGKDEDVLRFVPTSLGSNTSGTWSQYFDGSDLALDQSSEDTGGIWAKDLNGDLFLTSRGNFSATGLSGSGADIYLCGAGILGSNTDCTLNQYLNGAAHGIGGESLDGIMILEESGTNLLMAARILLDTVGDSADISDNDETESVFDVDDEDKVNLYEFLYLPMINQ